MKKKRAKIPILFFDETSSNQLFILFIWNIEERMMVKKQDTGNNIYDAHALRVIFTS
jgi:hypothetical protein